MAVVNTTQSMLDPISSAVEYGMENVSKIGNSLKEDGVVSENAYPAMNETIRARRVNRFERLNDTLEGAENIASNLSSVTSSAVSVKEDYQQLREDSKELRDKANAFNTADSEARAALKAELPTEITAITLAPAPAEDES
jgi:septation ring formation regulator EzrA